MGQTSHCRCPSHRGAASSAPWGAAWTPIRVRSCQISRRRVSTGTTPTSGSLVLAIVRCADRNGVQVILCIQIYPIIPSFNKNNSENQNVKKNLNLAMVSQAERRARVRALNPNAPLVGACGGSDSGRAPAAISACAVPSRPARTPSSQPPPRACRALGAISSLSAVGPEGGVGVRGLWRMEQAPPLLGHQSTRRLQHRAAPLAKRGLPPPGAPAPDGGRASPPGVHFGGDNKRARAN